MATLGQVWINDEQCFQTLNLFTKMAQRPRRQNPRL